MKESVNIMTDQAVKKEVLPEGIYIEAKEVTETNYHAYLVYRDGKGNAEVIRGGPESLPKTRIGGKVSIGGWDLFDTGEIDITNNMGTRLAQSGLGGDIEIEAGIPLGKSLDAYGEEDNPQKRFAKRIVGGKISKPIWDDMVKTAQTIGTNKTDYNLLSQKCNSIVATVLNRSGLNDHKIFHNLEERN